MHEAVLSPTWKAANCGADGRRGREAVGGVQGGRLKGMSGEAGRRTQVGERKGSALGLKESDLSRCPVLCLSIPP